MLTIYGETIYLDTLIVNPALRHQGYATKIICELMQHLKKIIPFDASAFVAQVHKENDISKKLLGKLGFHFICTEAEINDDWFDWIYPATAASHHIASREEIG